MNYIKLMADASKTPQHEVILQCLDYWGANGIRDVTEKQIKDFCEKELKEVSDNGSI